MNAEQTAPTSADKVLPPRTGQGWASGLDGMPNTRTALAPSDATIQGPALLPPAHQRLSNPVSSTPITAPTMKRSLSRPSIPNGAGQKWRNHRARRTRMDWEVDDEDGADERGMKQSETCGLPAFRRDGAQPLQEQATPASRVTHASILQGIEALPSREPPHSRPNNPSGLSEPCLCSKLLIPEAQIAAHSKNHTIYTAQKAQNCTLIHELGSMSVKQPLVNPSSASLCRRARLQSSGTSQCGSPLPNGTGNP